MIPWTSIQENYKLEPMQYHMNKSRYSQFIQWCPFMAAMLNMAAIFDLHYICHIMISELPKYEYI